MDTAPNGGLPIVTGSLQKLLVSRTTKYDPTNGKSVVTEWVGTNDTARGHAGDALIGYALSLEKSAGVSYELKQKGAKTTLIETASDAASTGREGATTDRWDVLTNENMQDVKEFHTWTNLLPKTRALILKEVDKYHKGKTPANPADLEFVATEPTPEGKALATSFFDVLVRGVTHFPVYNFVLRHTTNASADDTRNVADVGVGTVYPTASLLTEISDSSLWTYPCPPRLREKIGNLTFPFSAGFTNGWLKKPSQESSTANNRIDISTEYVFAQWANVFYA
jgi:hypothetical protein